MPSWGEATVAGDAIRVREALTGASSTWEIRLRMAAMGWLSQTRIMDERRGGACFQIWFKRQDWHGRLSEVTFHSGCQVPLDRGDGCGAGGDTAAMHAEAIDAALRATDAWDRFPDSIPCQMPDHTTVDSGYRTAQAFGPDSRGVHPRGFPTERLHDLDSLLDGGSPEADGLLLRACRLAALGMIMTTCRLTAGHRPAGISTAVGASSTPSPSRSGTASGRTAARSNSQRPNCRRPSSTRCSTRASGHSADGLGRMAPAPRAANCRRASTTRSFRCSMLNGSARGKTYWPIPACWPGSPPPSKRWPPVGTQGAWRTRCWRANGAR